MIIDLHVDDVLSNMSVLILIDFQRKGDNCIITHYKNDKEIPHKIIIRSLWLCARMLQYSIQKEAPLFNLEIFSLRLSRPGVEWKLNTQMMCKSSR